MIDPESLREHYGALSDEALMAVDRGELTEFARAFCDEEMERRGLSKDEAPPDVPSAPAGLVGPRLRDVRRAALVVCVATVLSVALPMWRLTRQILAMQSNIGQLGTIASLVVVCLFTTIGPLFCFALYRNEGGLLVSRNMRWVAMTAAVVIGILGVADIPGWIASFRRESVIDFTGRPWTIGDTSTALGEVANLASILLLVALFRLVRDGSERGVAVSKLLRVATKMAVIAGGIVAVGCVVGVAATPWVYSYIRDRSLAMGYSNARWTFWRLAADRGRMALTMICAFVAPFVVWRSSRTRVTSDYISS